MPTLYPANGHVTYNGVDIGSIAYVTAASADTSLIWTVWNQAHTTGVTTSCDTVWVQWNEQGQWAIAQPPGAERIAAQEQAGIECRRQQEEARERAEALLFVFLKPEQRAQYEKDGYFETEVNDSRYRIHRGRAGNIQKLDKAGKPVVQLCVHPQDWLPDADNVLAQYLALHTDEKALLKTANHTQLA